ncbi:MAG: hypothetical protein HY330_05870 [Chloroflexi bacterium]|nr:hypothetical protein [Chloroflexota bacterium]
MPEIPVLAGERSYMMVNCPECGSYLTVGVIAYRRFEGQLKCVFCKAVMQLKVGESPRDRHLEAINFQLLQPGDPWRKELARKQTLLPESR